MIKKITKLLSSLRFTIVLICLLGAIFIIGLWIPQKDVLKDIYFQWKTNSPGLVAFLDAFQLTSIYTSWLTLTLWIFFFINLSLVLWQRIPVIKKRIELTESRIADPETAPGYAFRGAYPLPEDLDGPSVIKSLTGRRFDVIGDENGFYGVKNRLSPIAFGLFHLSFFLILLGGLISFYSEFIGYVDLAQGEPFQGEIYRYNQKPKPKMPKIGSPPDASFTIQSINPQVVRNTPTGISVKLVDGLGKTHEVGINTPYRTAHSSFVFNHLGVAPLFVLKDPAGKEIGGSYFKLDVVKGKQDTFLLGGFKFTARFYPDYVLKDGRHTTKSMEFNNPVFAMTVEREGKEIATATLPKNGVMEFAGYRLEMRDMPFWVRFYVIKQRGLSLVYTGFFIASIAVIWRLLFYKREIIGAVREKDGARSLLVAGRSEYYKSLAEDEFTKLFDSILGKGRTNR